MIKYLDAEGLDRFLQEAARVLVPGGWLAMGEFGRDAGLLASGAWYAMDCGPDRFRTAEQQAVSGAPQGREPLRATSALRPSPVVSACAPDRPPGLPSRSW